MENLLDTYTKLKLNIGNEIIVTYHTSDGNKYTRKVILLDIEYFDNILVAYNNILMCIPFSDSNVIIESITLNHSPKPIYLNPYFNSNPSLNYEQLEKATQDTFKNIKLALEKREKIIEKYLSASENVKYEDLFFSQKQKEEFELFFHILIKELSEYAQKNGFNPELKEISIGTTSIIYEIGDKIIKVGKPRRYSTIPYCEYLLQPIINRDLTFDDYPIHLEITQKVLVLDNKDGFASQSEDERFNEVVSVLNKGLYSIGLSSDDLHPGNVGILLQDNKIHFEGITFDTANEEVTSIDNNNNLRILPKGRFVIIDLDALEIEDEEKYNNYLRSIGFNKNKTRTLSPNNNQ